MKLKLSHKSFAVLFSLMVDAAGRPTPKDNMYEKLLQTIMVGIYKKLYAKTVEKKASYRITLTPVEAIAFWEYWTDHDYPCTTLAGNLLNQLCNSIHQKFTV